MSSNKIYLTFDDGPNPILTPYVLDVLKEHQLKATFFCVGENVVKYPELTQRILEEGHRIGNHTQQHLNAFKVTNQDYLNSVQAFNKHTATSLFRPPYGRLKWFQAVSLSKQFQIIMWTWLTYDFDVNYSIENILKDAEKLKSGDIIVLHDNDKIETRLKALLPSLIQLIKAKGFECAVIPD